MQARKDEHEQLQLRPLTPAAQQRFTTAWVGVQSRFVDTPALALAEADSLVTQLLAERGYPVDDFDGRQRLLSVEHADVLDGCRRAHDVELASRARTADTETVRTAFLDFRRVFESVMDDSTSSADPSTEHGTGDVTAQGSRPGTIDLTTVSDGPYPDVAPSSTATDRPIRR